MSFAPKRFNKNCGGSEIVNQNTNVQSNRKNNQNNKILSYKNKINLKDESNSKDKETPKFSRSRNKEYQNINNDPKFIEAKNDLKKLNKCKEYLKTRKGKNNLETNKNNQTIKKQEIINPKKKPVNKQNKIRYKNTINNIKSVKTEAYTRYVNINDPCQRKQNKKINNMNEKLIFEDLKRNKIDKKELTQQNNRLFKKTKVENFSVTDNKKSLKIVKGKSIENYIISKTQKLNIFPNKKILEFFIVKKENINILHNRKKPKPLSLKRNENIYIQSNKKTFENKEIQVNLDIDELKKNNNNDKNLIILSTLSSSSENSEKSSKTNEKIKNEIIKLPNSPKGLSNFSLNCYMNSILQCLYHIKQLRTSFIKPENFDKETQKVCYNFSKVINGLTYSEKSYYSPKDFKETFAKINPLFSGVKGGDVKDLLHLIISSVIEEIPYEEPDDDSEEDNTNQTKSFNDAKKVVDTENPMNKAFNYYEEVIFNCPGCHNKCYSIQNETTIDFDLLKISKKIGENDFDIYKCFDYNYNSVNTIKFSCDKCQKCFTGEKREKILIPAKNMILILDRGKGKKFDGDVDFYEYINIEKYVDDTFIEEKNKKFYYKLIGVSTHMGSSSDCGHYIAYCYRENENEYFCFNDEYSRIVDFKDVKNNSPYILFYEQCEEIPEKIEKNEFNININPKNVNKKDNKEEKILKQNLIDILEDFKTENNSFSIDYYDFITENPLNLKLLIDKKGRQPLPFKMDFSNNFPEKIPKISIDFDDKNSSIIKKLEKYRRNIQDPAQLKKYILELIKYII